MFQEAIARAVTRLDRARQKNLLEQFALIGGFAVARWGLPRATAVVDFIVRLGKHSPGSLADHLNGKYRKGDLRDPLLGAITFEVEESSSVIPVQLLIFPLAWEQAAFVDVTEDEIGGAVFPFVHWKALVLLKLYAGSALDLSDARAVLAANHSGKRELDALKKQAARLRVSRRLSAILEDR